MSHGAILFGCKAKINLFLKTICYFEFSELLSQALSNRSIHYYKSGFCRAAALLT